MNTNIKSRILILFFALCSFLLSAGFLGLENLRFDEINWLLGSGDISNAQNGWTFFKNDSWHFPLGKNPNYGLDISNSIIFSDSIPILAFIFKIFKNFLSINFQYFSFWVFLCFFFQFYFSYTIIYNNTNSIYFSLISSIFFIISPIFLYRLGIHLSLGAHWIILFAYYINFYVEKKIKKYFWIFLLILSTLIHLYFTAMLFVIYGSLLVGDVIKNKKVIEPVTELCAALIFVLLLMYIFGYFEADLFGSVSKGYGKFGLDILGVFDPQTNEGKFNWSFFLNNIKGTSLEGFNYLGLGIIVLLTISILIYLFNIAKNKNYIIETFKYKFEIVLIIFLLSSWSITSNIYLKGEEIFSLPLHNYILGALSIFGATGRFFWPVYYLIIILSLFYIFKYLGKKYAEFIITIILLIQIIDISPGLSNYFLNKNHISKPKILNSDIWKTIPNDYEKIRTTYLFNNYGPVFSSLNHFLGTSNIKKTDIVLNTSMSRSKAAKARYDFNNALYNKLLPSDTAYVVDNLGHLRQMKIYLKDTNDGFFYRDNIWIVLPNKKTYMTNEDVDRITKIKFKTLEINKEYKFNFHEKHKLLGVGWSHNSGGDGVWSDGNISFILFNLQEYGSGKLNLNFTPYKGNKNENFKVKIYFNNKLKKTMKLNHGEIENYVSLNFEKGEIAEENIIMFKFDNLISPFDIFESPDARKLGILLKSMTVETN